MIKVDKNYLLYGCASKEDFELVREQREQFNYKVWRILVVLCSIYFSILFLTTFSVDVVRANSLTDLTFAVIFLVDTILLYTVIKADSKWLLPLIYIGICSLLAFGTMVGVVLSPEYLAVTYHVLMIGLPLFLVDKPYRLALLNLVSSVVFVILCLAIKTGGTEELDIYNAVVFAVLGQFVNFYMAGTKMQQFLTVKKIELASITDELTRLYNRKAYEEDILELQQDAAADTAVLVAFDVNGLKTVNDTLGHNAGDEMLRGAAESIRKCFSPYGKTYRVGGDEFAAIIHADHAELEAAKQRFDQTLAAWHGEYIPTLSVATGHAAMRDYPDITVVELAKIADHEMYENKRAYYLENGLNRRRT